MLNNKEWFSSFLLTKKMENIVCENLLAGSLCAGDIIPYEKYHKIAQSNKTILPDTTILESGLLVKHNELFRLTEDKKKIIKYCKSYFHSLLQYYLDFDIKKQKKKNLSDFINNAEQNFLASLNISSPAYVSLENNTDCPQLNSESTFYTDIKNSNLLQLISKIFAGEIKIQNDVSQILTTDLPQDFPLNDIYKEISYIFSINQNRCSLLCDLENNVSELHRCFLFSLSTFFEDKAAGFDFSIKNCFS